MVCWSLVGFEVLTALSVWSVAFWNVTPCCSVDIAGRFGGTYCLQLIDRRVSQKHTEITLLAGITFLALNMKACMSL
jgi:hypothetical protein